MIDVLNLGAGVQSSCVFLMSAVGELPKLDHAIFADTGWEPQAVYDHLEWLKRVADDSGIRLHVVTNGDIKHDALTAQVAGGALGQDANGAHVNRGRWASMPYYTVDRETGKRGMIRRQCTYEYKIRPIKKCLRRTILGLKPRQRAPQEPVIRQWFGISTDEVQRMRRSDEKWSTFYYPLVEKRMTRSDCLAWMDRHGFPAPPRSACVGCPFHSNAEWLALSPAEFEDACRFDESIRKMGGMRGDVFLHSDRVPLREVNLHKGLHDPNQLPLWQDECEGMCGT